MKRFLALLLVLALPPAIYFPTLGAQRRQTKALADGDLEDLERRVEQARAAQRKFPRFREEQARLSIELRKVRIILPPVLDLEGFRATASASAQHHGLQLTRFEPRPPQQSLYTEQSITTEVVGNAAAAAAFLSDLDHMDRMVKVTVFTMRKDPAGWRIAFILTIYAMHL